MKIKLLKPWGMSAPGEVLPNVADGVAEQLIHRGIAKAVESAPETKPLHSKIRRK